jgi:protein involved in polysaccharide export with SLBB domain
MRKLVALLSVLLLSTMTVSPAFPESSAAPKSKSEASRLAERDSLPFQTIAREKMSTTSRAASAASGNAKTDAKSSGAPEVKKTAPTTTSKPTGKPTGGTPSEETKETADVVGNDVFVVGEVDRRGAFPYDPRLNPRDYLLLAGVEPQEMSETVVQVLRQDGTMLPLKEITQLERGDTLIVLSPEAAALIPSERQVPPDTAPAAPVPTKEPQKLEVPQTPEEQRGVRVAGAVARPFRFAYDARWTLDDYLARAGGVMQTADTTAIRVFRANGQLRDATQVTQLLPGDTILVPELPLTAIRPTPTPPTMPAEGEAAEMPSRIAVTGAVARPMSFLYQPALGVNDYLRLAGGATNVGDITRIRILRRDGSFARPPEPLKPGDIIVVPTIRADFTVTPLSDEDALRSIEEEATRQTLSESEQVLQRFGISYFEGSRNYIRNLEEQVTRARLQAAPEGASAQPADATKPLLPPTSAIVKDAISGFVGPTDLLNANALVNIPHNQIIEPGDTLYVTSWSETSGQPPTTIAVTVEPDGGAVVPPYGRMTVVGMTLEQFERAVRDFMARTTFTDLKVVATFDRLRTIQVSIVGNAFRPGNYATSAATTLFNALYLSGGPSDSGSLRNITLKRGDKTIHVDFYRYLLNGDADQDVKLEGGDVIWIGPARRQVTATGEFLRPSIYELAENEGFSELVSMALGIRPSGFAKTVQIESVDGHAARVIRTLDATGTLADAPVLLDGDRVTVYPVLSEPVNTVQAKGYVKQPRLYEFREGMRVADLVRTAGGLRDGAFRDRADLYRRNDDGQTATLIPVDLNAALEGSPDANLPLFAYDRLVVYSAFEVDWRPKPIASAQGAVSRPGNYPRADGMRISDLLRVAGGVRPDGFAEHGLLLRVDARNRLALSVPVNLKALEDDSDLILLDGDVLLVLTYDEARWEPAREVRVTGVVQTPGLVPYAEGMRLTDALFRAGGALPDHAQTALILRKDPERWDKVTRSIVVDLNAALDGNANADVPLQPEDELIVYRTPDVKWEPAQQVTVVGAVQKGDTYPRTERMRVSDLLFRAGGILPNAYLERADLYRYMEDYERQVTIPVNLENVLRGDANADIPLQDGDTLRVSTLREATFLPENIITIYGAVQRPDTYIYTENMRLLDLIHLAGDVLPGSNPKVEIARARQQDETTLVRTDLPAALAGDASQNVVLMPGDIVSVTRHSLFLDTPRLAAIEGAVAYPGVYAVKTTERISDLIQRAGGLTPNGYAAGAVLTREDDRIVSALQRQSLDELWEMIDQTNTLEHERALARARVEAQKEGATVEPLTESLSSITAPIAGALGASALTKAETASNESGTTRETTTGTTAI